MYIVAYCDYESTKNYYFFSIFFSCIYFGKNYAVTKFSSSLWCFNLTIVFCITNTDILYLHIIILNFKDISLSASKEELLSLSEKLKMHKFEKRMLYSLRD